MTDIETIKVLLGNTGISDDFIALYLESTKQFVLSYCNIQTVPDALKPTLLEMAALRVRANSSGALADIGAGVKQVASISDGNQSIGYAIGSAGGKQFVSEEDLISSFGNILDRFRCMVVDYNPPYKTLGSRCLHTRACKHDSWQHPNDTRW